MIAYVATVLLISAVCSSETLIDTAHLASCYARECELLCKGVRAVMQGSASFLNRKSSDAIFLDHALASASTTPPCRRAGEVLIVLTTIITVSFAVCKVRPRPRVSLETSLVACHPFQVKVSVCVCACHPCTKGLSNLNFAGGIS